MSRKNIINVMMNMVFEIITMSTLIAILWGLNKIMLEIISILGLSGMALTIIEYTADSMHYIALSMILIRPSHYFYTTIISFMKDVTKT